MSNLIDERDERTKRRKKTKRKMDSIIGLSNNVEKGNSVIKLAVGKLADTSIRLLDEGFCDQGFVIKKGTLEKFLNGKNEYIRGYEMDDNGEWQETEVLNLDDDFTGTVNLGHMDFATFPFIIGEWKKSDLSLVDIENDRKGLDVDIRLDDDSLFVKELQRQPFDIGVSSEFYYHINEEDTESLSEMLGYFMPVIDEVYIFAYALVGECGNVNSSGLELKGETMSVKEIKKMADENLDTKEAEVEEATEAEETEAEEVANETVELSAEETEAEETVEAEAEETSEEEVSDPDETEGEESDDAEEVSEEAEIEEAEVEETESEEDDSEEANGLAEALSYVTSLKDEVENLKKANAELKKTNRRLQNKLANEKREKEEFLESTKKLSVELLPNEDAKGKEEADIAKERAYLQGDGIAE